MMLMQCTSRSKKEIYFQNITAFTHAELQLHINILQLANIHQCFEKDKHSGI